jgi:hypothetical protein
VAHVDVFVDDFIGIAQGTKELCRDTRRCILNAVDTVFATCKDKTSNRKEAVSEKKLDKGDGGWSQWKEVLGWMFDTENGTMELTERRKERVSQIFDDLRGKRRVSQKK